MKPASKSVIAYVATLIAAAATALISVSVLAQTAPAASPNPEQVTPAPASPGAQNPAAQGPRHLHHGQRGESKLKGLDIDGDGSVSRAEFDAQGQRMAQRRAQMFDMADANKDGKLSAEEIRSFRQNHRAQRGRNGDLQRSPTLPSDVTPKG